MLGYLGVSIIGRTLDMDHRIFSVRILLVYVYTQGTSVYGLIRRTFVQSAQNLTPGKSRCGRKALHVTVTHPCDKQARSCLTLVVIERSRVRIPAGTAGEFSSPGSTFCADSYFGIRSTPVLPQ